MIINGYTAEHMQTIEDATIVSGAIDGTGHLMLVRHDGTQIDAGYFGLSASSINAAVDFNTLTTPGAYIIPLSATVAASTNQPNPTGVGWTANQAGFLLVEGNGGTFVKQTWMNYNNSSEVAIRSRYNNGAWYTWNVPVKVASNTRAGLIEISTAAENTTGTDDTRAVTPLGLATVLAAIPGYKLSQIVLFTASGTFTKASYPGLKAVRVRVVGGGAAGGGVALAQTSNHSCGGGGGGGGYAESLVLAANLATSETVTVGAGGTSGSGGTSSFGTKASANGGGVGGTISNQPLMVAAVGGNGGVATIGDIKASGSPGVKGSGNATLGHGGEGGSSLLGGGGVGTYAGGGGAVTPGVDASGYGGGGGGAAANSGSTGGASGGAGTAGVVIVEVYV